MHIYNIKINGGKALKIIIILLSLFMLMVFLFSIYKIFFSSGKFFVKDRIEQNEIKEINADEYTNILQAVHDDLDSYIGLKIKFSGYVYRILDFNEKQFVLGRDMLINTENNQSVVVVFLLFAIFIWRGVLIAMKAPDMFGSLVAIGITSLVGVQVIINIAVVTSSMPVTGMQLPFFSYGGTALFLLLCEMGVLLSISRASSKQ